MMSLQTLLVLAVVALALRLLLRDVLPGRTAAPTCGGCHGGGCQAAGVKPGP